MTQDDREIKTISQKTISRNFVAREISSEPKLSEKLSHGKREESQKIETASRREVIQNIFPTVAQGTSRLLRSLSVKLSETLDKIEKL